MQRLAAWSVHLFTASSALWALLALVAIGEWRFRAALFWMTVAVVVDGLDGALARLADVRRNAPSIDGALLDNLMDYLSYVFVPACLMHEAGILPERAGLVGPALICFASAFQFAHVQAKTADHFFRGFPCYWNLVVFYLLLLRPDPGVSLAIVVTLCVLVFVPVRYVYPSRTVEYRPLTLSLTAAWAVVLCVMLYQYPTPSPWLLYGSLLYVAYYVALSVALTARGRGGVAAPGDVQGAPP